MVSFNKLRLVGFKSFVDSTELLIEPGLTGIVGPNGCGKSNLVEALRWAMGETSAKQLRGGEMDDVIFSGSTTRPGRNVAEVMLLLDNSDRKMPSQFNDNDLLEITRRIERGAGSSYVVNGSEVRQRDVQLLFADSATGAHSTALVSQGRVGAIINAKPTDRRSLLEEAAGITGLHSRRHEAELRLRAAEANLSRLDDVIVTLESQLQTLKKQARQASRYRNIADQIRRVEATLLNILWRDVVARRAAAQAEMQEAEASVVDLTGKAAAAASRQGEIAADLPELRDAEAAAAAELQRLTIARESLNQEETRVNAARTEAAQRLTQVLGDIGRAGALIEDAKANDARLQVEHDDLTAAATAEAGAASTAGEEVTAAQAAVDGSETTLSGLLNDIASGEALERATRQRIAELEDRLELLHRRATEIAEERAKLEAASSDHTALDVARRALTERQTDMDGLQNQAADLEQTRAAATQNESSARSRWQQLAESRAQLSAEQRTLAKLLTANQSDLWPPILNDVTVAAGYEAALGVALGDDLTASAAAGALIRWEALPPLESALPLPEGAVPLSQFVQGHGALQRRLRQIGVVETDAEGNRLSASLAQGQRLVTRHGALWRWDGFRVEAGATTAAETRLKQRARLTEVEAELAGVERQAAEAESKHQEARRGAEAAEMAARQWRDGLQSALRAIEQARSAFDTATNAAAATVSRLATLEEMAAGAARDIGDSETALAAVRKDAHAIPDLLALQASASEARSKLSDLRTRLIDRRSTHDRLEREAEARRRRLTAIAGERQSWMDRLQSAEQQNKLLDERRIAVEAEIEVLTKRPAEIAEQRGKVNELIDTATVKRREAADRLAETETRLAEAIRQLKGAEHDLAVARENRVRAEGHVAQVEEAAQGLEARIRDRLDCTPEETAGIAELDEGEMPEREAIEAKLLRLTRERDNMGPVNLRAETEATEVEQQIAGLQSERSDLVNAIARLRSGIQSLNREGRERLLAAFELVNNNFQKLFTRLFGGGHAHLKLTESEDPLEAGLEIMASPPGKRLQVMSLLSGGEQALTALSLLFAVFLTNPAPICVLDEVDAPLDDANVDRFCTLVEELAHSTSTRFLVITHHRMTMARMDRLFGVTMAERGVSQLVSVDLQRVTELKAIA
ncbi:MAG TPA: chromosome segregation protein SMC [Verrucomicrobiae bacterium]|nr:chromosome segregation protein SMC [Verrucomicrobiae bacterium]